MCLFKGPPPSLGTTVNNGNNIYKSCQKWTGCLTLIFHPFLRDHVQFVICCMADILFWKEFTLIALIIPKFDSASPLFPPFIHPLFCLCSWTRSVCTVDSLETMRKLLKLFASAHTQTLASERSPRYCKLCTYCNELCSRLSSPASRYLSLLQSMMSNNGSGKTKYTFEGTYSKFLHFF